MNRIIIKVESGVVAEIYLTEPAEITVVDHDVIEGGESFEERMRKAVLSVTTEGGVKPEDVDALIRALVLECRRPADRSGGVAAGPQIRAAA